MDNTALDEQIAASEEEDPKKVDSMKTGGEQKDEPAWDAEKLFRHHALACISKKNRGSWSNDDFEEIVLKMWRKDRKRNRPYWAGLAEAVIESSESEPAKYWVTDKSTRISREARNRVIDAWDTYLSRMNKKEKKKEKRKAK